MKTNFTILSFRSFVATFVMALTTLSLSGQTTHNVSVIDFQFNPSTLNINVGDKVIWTHNGNVNHNVNGTQTTYPTNPESFGNNVGVGWTYEYTFNTAGTYNYVCDPHAPNMAGSVTVTGTTSSRELAGLGSMRIFPNPASEFIELLVPVNHEKISFLKVYAITGALIDQKMVADKIESFRYDLSGFKNGVYFMEIHSGTQKNILKFIKK